MSAIAYEGKWTATWGAIDAISHGPLEDFVPGDFTSVNLHNKINQHCANEASRVARKFGRRICEEELWKLGRGVEFSIEIEKEDLLLTHRYTYKWGLQKNLSMAD